VKRLAIVSALLLALSLVGVASATPPTPSSGAIWGHGVVEYRWMSGNEPPGWIRGAINAAAQNAHESSQADSPDFRFDSGGSGWIGYTGDIPSSYAVGYAIRNPPDSFGIRLRPHGYQLDWGTLRWCQFYDSPPNGCYDAEMITLHEFGHVLTLGHIDEDTVTDWLDTVMHASPKTKAKAGWNAHAYGRCDVARLQLRYEAASPSERISTCLELGTDLSISASPGTTVAYGASVTLSATLRIENTTKADNLAGEGLSGRSVWLQRRAIGGSTWVDVGQMSGQPEAGRYGRSVNVTAPFDYRVRFTATSNEGLGDATSNTLRISVDDPCVSSSTNGSINAPTC
jgi:hypothetical protein